MGGLLILAMGTKEKMYCTLNASIGQRRSLERKTTWSIFVISQLVKVVDASLQ